MPRKSAIKCYFGCVTEGPFHQFPKPDYPSLEKFKQWKMVLSEDVKQKGDSFIYNNVRLCNRHFIEVYHSASKRLTKNAVPTLNLWSTLQTVLPSSAVETEMEIDHKDHPCQLQDVGLSQDASQKHLLSHRFLQPKLLPIASTSQTVPPLYAVETEMEIEMQTDQPCQLQDGGLTQDVPKTDLLSHSAPQRKLIPKVNIRTQKSSKELRNLKIRILKLRNKCKTLNQKVREAKKLSQSQAFLKAVEKLPAPAAIFTNMQLRKTSKKPRGRRFNMKEKLLCLTILKQSQKAYNLLQRLFTLPSKRTLQKILSSISLTPGINDVIMQHLKKAVRKLPEEKKLCSLIFDEVALTPGLYFQKATDEIVGFEDFGERKTTKIADHALVFMLKSLKGKYKQPICFNFCQSATKSADLKKLIKNIIDQVHSTGLTIICTVCDQAATNMSVINSLTNETKENYLRNETEYKSLAFEINDRKIFPIYDTPHLLKGLRNNFMTKNLKYTQNGETKLAKWDHLQMLLDIDVGEHDIRLVNKLTDSHVNKDKIPKMKVKHAAQVFSQRVSAAMRFLAKHNILPVECFATADLLLLVDKLFDSFNGHLYRDSAKIYKSALKQNSPHHKLWDEMLPILQSMEFKVEKDGTSKFVKVPSVRNWIHNIHVFKEMFSYLIKTHNVSSLLTRNFNQDPLENFFCNIRSNGIRNISPTCCQFIGAYKTLLVNNLTSPHSVGANCERDNNKILKPIKCLINIKTKSGEERHADINVDSLINLFEHNANTEPSNITNKEAKRYVAGYLVNKSIKKICTNCSLCKMQLLSTTPPKNNDYILERDYTNKSLKYPSETLCSFLDEVCMVVQTQLNEEPHIKNIKELISQKINIFCNFSFLTCEKHKNKLYAYLINVIINVIIHSWCTNVNRLLKGKITSEFENNNIKAQAIKYYNTYNKRKNK